MSEIGDLHRLTSLFFERHWPRDWGEAPTWHCWAPPFRGPAPNYNRCGCYALAAAQEILYVGLGIRRGEGDRKDHGISLRLLAHGVRPNPDGTHYLQDQWAGVSEIWTIGFEGPRVYLAPALECYLIAMLHPRENSYFVRASVE